MSYTYSDSVTLTTLTCATCGCVFAIPEHYEAKRRGDHGSFYCPNGHKNYFPQQSEAERLQKLYELKQRSEASLRENMIAAQRAQQRVEKKLSQLKKRAAVGLCPCCNRTVSQLARHMESKHKEFLALNGLGEQKALPSASSEKVQ